MKPLIEQVQGLDDSERQLAELFVAAEPCRSDPFRKRRILVRLSKQRMASRSAWRPAIVVTMLLGITAAAATVGRSSIKASWNRLWSQHEIESPNSGQQSTHQPVTPALPSSSEPRDRSDAVADQPLPPPTAVQQVAGGSATARPRAPVEPIRAATSEDPSQVVSAIRALRNEHNPGRAKTLLSSYLQTHPQGALTEDVLALSIEAAAATNDPKSSDFARTYLAKYPNGRYRSLAVRTLGR